MNDDARKGGGAPLAPVDRGQLLGKGLPHLLDERSDSDFRRTFGLLARRSSALDSAVARIRLTGLDLRSDELRSLGRIRVLLAHVSALTLRAEAEAVLADRTKALTLKRLVRRIERGNIEVRAAPLAGWAPDFSVFHRSGRPWMLMVGLHWFARPYPHLGPALTSIHGRSGAALAAARFDDLWRRAHDIGPAILDVLHEAVLRVPEPPSLSVRRRRDQRASAYRSNEDPTADD